MVMYVQLGIIWHWMLLEVVDLSVAAVVTFHGVDFPVCMATSSCNSRCGQPRELSGVHDCACDEDCYSAGDCCLDFEHVCITHTDVPSNLTQLIEERLKIMYPDTGPSLYTDVAGDYTLWQHPTPLSQHFHLLHVNTCTHNPSSSHAVSSNGSVSNSTTPTSKLADDQRNHYQLCHNGQKGEILLPVLSEHNGIIRVFRNIHCAACDDSNTWRRAKLWFPDFVCTPWVSQYAMSLYMGAGPEELFTFLLSNCEQVYSPIPSAYRSVTLPNHISNCSQDFVEGHQQHEALHAVQACHAFHAPVQTIQTTSGTNIIYANAFCAYCNGISSNLTSTLSCDAHQPYVMFSKTDLSSFNYTFSFATGVQLSGSAALKGVAVSLNKSPLCPSGSFRKGVHAQRKCESAHTAMTFPHPTPPPDLEPNYETGVVYACFDIGQKLSKEFQLSFMKEIIEKNFVMSLSGRKTSFTVPWNTADQVCIKAASHVYYFELELDMTSISSNYYIDLMSLVGIGHVTLLMLNTDVLKHEVNWLRLITGNGVEAPVQEAKVTTMLPYVQLSGWALSAVDLFYMVEGCGIAERNGTVEQRPNMGQENGQMLPERELGCSPQVETNTQEAEKDEEKNETKADIGIEQEKGLLTGVKEGVVYSSSQLQVGLKVDFDLTANKTAMRRGTYVALIDASVATHVTSPISLKLYILSLGLLWKQMI